MPSHFENDLLVFISHIWRGGGSSASNQKHNNIYTSVFYFKPGDVQKISDAVREHQNINYIIIGEKIFNILYKNNNKIFGEKHVRLQKQVLEKSDLKISDNPELRDDGSWGWGTSRLLPWWKCSR